MAIQYLPGAGTVNDVNTATGPTATSNTKELYTKTVRLSFSNFTSAGVNALVAILPADASIMGFRVWTGTALSGNTVSAPTLTIGNASGGAQFASAVAVTNTTGTFAFVTPVTGIMQNYQVPLGADISIWVRGLCTSGPPTAGEVFLTIEYAR